MVTIKGIYDEGKIELLEEVPFKGRKKVIVTFLEESVENSDTRSEVSLIASLRGCAKSSNVTEKLLESRREDLELEEEKWRK